MTPWDIFGPILALLATVGGIGVIPLLVWMDHRHKQRMKQMEIDEQTRLLERGEGEYLRQLARAGADKERSRAVGAIGVAVGLGAIIGGTIISAYLLALRDSVLLLPILAVVWSLVAAVVIVTVVCCVRALRRPVGDETRRAPSPPPRLADAPAERYPGSTAFQERAEK